MTELDIELRRKRDLERYHRRTAERVALGLCPKCGKHPPEPGRSQCGPCLEMDRAAGRARDARLRAAGIPRRDLEKAREYERERTRHQTDPHPETGRLLVPKQGVLTARNAAPIPRKASQSSDD